MINSEKVDSILEGIFKFPNERKEVEFKPSIP